MVYISLGVDTNRIVSRAATNQSRTLNEAASASTHIFQIPLDRKVSAFCNLAYHIPYYLMFELFASQLH